jgi:hypothetical protein
MLASDDNEDAVAAALEDEGKTGWQEMPLVVVTPFVVVPFRWTLKPLV